MNLKDVKILNTAVEREKLLNNLKTPVESKKIIKTFRVAKMYGLYGLIFFNPKIVRIVRIYFQIVRIVRIFILENTPFF